MSGKLHSSVPFRVIHKTSVHSYLYYLMLHKVSEGGRNITMMFKRRLSILWILFHSFGLSLSQSATMACPEKCECLVGGDSTTVVCIRQQYRRVPTDIPTTTQALLFSDNHLKELKRESFSVSVKSIHVFFIMRFKR